MTADGPAPSDAAAVYDAETLVDLAQAFGRPRLMQLLAGLDEEILRRLHPPAPGGEPLGRDAHVLTSVSGTLGFEPLSRACAALERACLAGEDVAEPLRATCEAAAPARRAIAALRSGAP